MSHPWFTGRTAVLATKHGKETVIAPLLADLGVQVLVPPEFDSDRFGTFTREIPRAGTQREAARTKAEAALALTGADLAIASEGSFGPHPLNPFLPSDQELVLWLDPAHQFEAWGLELTTATNYAQQAIANVDEALAFAERVGFPDHGLVLKPQADPEAGGEIYKGIQDRQTLTTLVQALSPRTGTLWLETDMRAHCNPTRMQAIARATADLVAKLRRPCPQCDSPGFDCRDRQPGLPCAWCGTPTSLTREVIWGCWRCHYQQPQLHPEGRTTADPTYCPRCNP